MTMEGRGEDAHQQQHQQHQQQHQQQQPPPQQPPAPPPPPPPSQLDFLPVNQANSPPNTKVRRAYLSCERCRKRKSRCEPLNGQHQPCKRCCADSQQCEFRTLRNTKRKWSTQIEPDSAEERAVRWRTQFDQDDTAGWPSPDRPSSLRGPMSPPPPPIAADASPAAVPDLGLTGGGDCQHQRSAVLDARARLVSAHLHNTADALDLLTFAATTNPGQNGPDTTSTGGFQALPSQVSPIGDSSIHESGSSSSQTSIWAGFALIRKGIIKQQEVAEYLDFFFDRLWPLKPVVPAYYREKSRYSLLVTEEPLLLICLLSLASRYHSLSGTHGDIRSERIHWQLWKVLQRSLQAAMWGARPTRSLGAIASMLLLIEWHVKAINNPMDFTEGDDEVLEFDEDFVTNLRVDIGDTSPLTGQRRYGMTSLMEKLNIMSPAYRSNKMCWILLSNAIALAHEGCCFDYEIHNPAVDRSEADAIKHEWSRVLCVFIYVSDERLATRLGLEPLLPEKSRQVVRERFSATFSDTLPHSILWEGYFELFVEARKGREFLHSLRRSETSQLSRNIVPDLEHLNRVLSRWQRQYHNRYAYNENTFLSASLDMEYHYITMYSFAPAAHALQAANKDPNQNTEALSRFADQAAQASLSLLRLIVDVFEPHLLMRFLPVRAWLYIVAASLHLLKATLAKNPHVSESDPNIQLLRSVVVAIHNGSPDDMHMCLRYSKFLGIVLQATMQTTSESRAANASCTAGGEREMSKERGLDNEENIFGTVESWEIPLDFDLVSDPAAWWDSPFGRNGFSRFP